LEFVDGAELGGGAGVGAGIGHGLRGPRSNDATPTDFSGEAICCETAEVV
jgi:hypothetical protein